jgi:hypothetical protein
MEEPNDARSDTFLMVMNKMTRRGTGVSGKCLMHPWKLSGRAKADRPNRALLTAASGELVQSLAHRIDEDPRRTAFAAAIWTVSCPPGQIQPDGRHVI